jgi:predicted membrane chloride channel (bestrophin family)
VKPYLIIINHRTWIALLISITTPYLCFNYNINFDIDLTLISIAIIFPLVFTIRGSFRRREKALEHLSEFRATIMTIDYFFSSNEVLTEEAKNEAYGLLLKVSDNLMKQLSANSTETADLDGNIHEVYEFLQNNKEAISGKRKEKIFRLMKDLHETIENVHAINIHRTPISLKAYCLIFIYIFPLIYAPAIINRVGPEQTVWITYFVVVFSQFILISLYNIQNQLEYPFDDKGLDDIKLDNFKINR